MARTRTWQMDWAGPHGTAWGTLNACLSTVTTAVLVHVAQQWVPITAVSAVIGTVIGTVLGIILVLLRAAVGRPRPRPPATVLYQACCWAGIGSWLIYMAADQDWQPRRFIAAIVALAIMAIIAGVLAGLAAEDRPARDSTTADANPKSLGFAQPVIVTQAQRDALAAEWEARLDRLCSGGGWIIPNIEHWPRGNGYTVEAIAPSGRLTWRAVDLIADDLAGDMDLPYGGGVTVRMGVSRKAALIEVTTVDVLAADYPYPPARPAHSIADDLEVGIRDDGSVVGPNLRQHCMVIAGEAGSGKSNALHCYLAEIVTTIDAVVWGWDLTGKSFTSWMEPWRRGDTDVPALDWVACDAQELLWMSRAALRVGQIRPRIYAQLMVDVDDDKVPVSATIPQVVVVGDEVARVTGAMTEHPQASNNLRMITFEHRAAGVRAAFFALRGTDDVITSSLQSQCQVRGVMRTATKAEATWILGAHHGFGGAEDTPYPGCGGLSMGSGAAPIRLKYFRILPSKIREIALHAATRRPQLDDPSRLAADGRDPDGVPLPGLLPGELDSYSTRWKRMFATLGGNGPAPAGAQGLPAVAATPADVTMDQAMSKLDQAMSDLDRAVAEANVRNARLGLDPDDITDLTAAEQAAFSMLAEGFGDDWQGPGEQETPPAPGDAQVLEELLRAAGEGGIGPQALLSQLAGRGIVVSRDTLHRRLAELRESGQVHQPRYGKWAWTG